MNAKKLMDKYDLEELFTTVRTNINAYIVTSSKLSNNLINKYCE